MAPAAQSSDEAIVLLHGLWMHGLAMEPLAWRLRQHYGFQVHVYDYPSVGQGIAPNSRQLAEFLRQIPTRKLHLVGHSLGGVLALKTLARMTAAPPGRVVCIGSPLVGSGVAAELARWTGGKAMLGKTIRESVLESPLSVYEGDREVGVIAGDLGFGIGVVTQAIAAPHDGTVSVSETQLPGITDHVVLPVTHTAMLLSRKVADQAVYFIRHGKFRRT
ncbi:MAG: esterase/lipase family protein [Gammaproteobacteria bacterium]